MERYLSRKIDHISLLGMIMVVYLHSYNLLIDFTNISHYPNSSTINFNSFMQNFISQGLTRVAVPIFFSISGYLFFVRINPSFLGFTKKIIRRFKTLMVPYFLWSVWGIVLIAVLQVFPTSRGYISMPLIVESENIVVLRMLFLDPIPYQLWFLLDLMILVMISPLLFVITKKLRAFVLLFPVIMWVMDYNPKIFSSEALLFFALGCYLAIAKTEFAKKSKTVSISLLCVWIAINALLACELFPEPIFHHTLYKGNILLGMCAIWHIYDHISEDIKNSTILRKLKSYSFFIYLSHEPVLTIFKKGLPIFLVGSPPFRLLVTYLIAPIIVIFLAVLVGSFLIRYSPRFYTIITGGRK